MITITRSDVQDRMRRELTDDEALQLAGIAQECSDYVEGYLGRSYAAGDDIPSAVITATSRAAARIYLRPSTSQEGADSRSAGMGPLSFTTHFSADALTAGPWLTKGEKMMLTSYRRSFTSVPMSRE